MVKADRFLGNPILTPHPFHTWESEAAFNGCVVEHNGTVHMLYRAMSSAQNIGDATLELSTIGYAESADKTTFTKRRQLIVPEHEWEKYGVEDPRVTMLNGKFYIFYTAISTHPAHADGIKVALGITETLSGVSEKHLITPFNAKAMALFPAQVNGKYVVILTANTDLPPSTIGIAEASSIEDFWNPAYWNEWYGHMENHAVALLRNPADQVEVGSPPIETEAGWLVIYSYIKNYRSNNPKLFGIEAVLLDRHNPRTILGQSTTPLMVPDEDYEMYGKVPNVIFPSGALLSNNYLGIYYGAADTTCALATVNVTELLDDIRPKHTVIVKTEDSPKLVRFSGNPIIKPDPAHHWESLYTFNPGAIYEGGLVHILYRAQGNGFVSVLGYAASRDGCTVDLRLPKPVYFPRDTFEMKLQEGFSGCEDPRITKIGDRLYMCYTAYNAVDNPRIALSSIGVDDFVHLKFNWDLPFEISQPDMMDKNACVLPEMVNGKYILMHRLDDSIWMDSMDSLSFGRTKWVKGGILMSPRPDRWDSQKIGIGPPPLRTKSGWLLIYHGLSKEDDHYRLGAALLDGNDPTKVISRLDQPILEPEAPYEHEGYRPKTVFACGAVIIGPKVYVYYGASDTYVCVASVEVERLLKALQPA